MKTKKNQSRPAYKVLVFKDGLQYGAMGPYLGPNAMADARNDAKAILADRPKGITARVIRTSVYSRNPQQIGLLGPQYSDPVGFPFYTVGRVHKGKRVPFKSAHMVESSQGKPLRQGVLQFRDLSEAVSFLESKGAGSHFEGPGEYFYAHLVTRETDPLVAWSSDETAYPVADEWKLKNAILYDASQKARRARSTAKRKGTWSQKWNPGPRRPELSEGGRAGDKYLSVWYLGKGAQFPYNVYGEGRARRLAQAFLKKLQAGVPWDEAYYAIPLQNPSKVIHYAQNINPGELGGPRRFSGHTYQFDEFFTSKRDAERNARHITDQEQHAARVVKAKGGYAVYKGPKFQGIHRGKLPRKRNPHLVPGEKAKVSHQYMEWLERFGHNHYTPNEIDTLRRSSPGHILTVLEQIPGGYKVFDDHPLSGHPHEQNYSDESLVSAESVTDAWPGTNYEGIEPPEADMRAAGWQISNPSYPEYGFYVVHKPSGKVLSGWEYREDAKDSLDEFLDSGVPSSHVSVMTARGVKGRFGGIEWVEGPLENPDVGQLVYSKGDLGRFTGKNEWMHGAEFWEVEMLEGHRRGQVVWVAVEGIGRVFPLDNPDWKALKEKAMQLAESAASAGKAGAARIKEEAELVGAKARIAKIQSEISKLEQCAKALGNVHSPKLPERYEIEDGRLMPGITEHNLVGGLNPGPKEGYEGLFEKREQLVDAKTTLKQLEADVQAARRERG